jgi:phage shock protein PspC (stress-responsive transcriptional regulator)
MATPATGQESVEKYLDGLAAQLGHLPPQARREELLRIRLRLEENLRRMENGRQPIAPNEPAAAAAAAPVAPVAPSRPTVAVPPRPVPLRAVPRGQAARPWKLAPKEAMWLGVCAGIAERVGIETGAVRLGALALGLLTGPFALFAYIIAYGVFSVQTPAEVAPKPQGWRAVGAVVASSASAVALFAMARVLCEVILRAHTLLMAPAVGVIPNPWNWFLQSGTTLLFWTLLWSAPLAVLGALPLPGGWSPTLRKTAQAVVAVMGIAAAFGVASLLTGAALQILPQYAGVVVAPGG